MSSFLIQEAAGFRLDQIYRYTRDKWDEKQAEIYISGLFKTFQDIAEKKILSRPIPAEFGVSGYYCRYRHHYVYWKRLQNGQIGIVTVLHEKMHQSIALFRDAESS